MKKQLLTCLSALALSAVASVPLDAQTGISVSDLSVPSRVAPLYFGPNAFQVPDMADGTVTGEFSAELRADYFEGRAAGKPDRTGDAAFRVTVPLWSDRVNICFWGNVAESYLENPGLQAFRRVGLTQQGQGGQPGLSGQPGTGDSQPLPLKGTLSTGVWYLSTDMLILRETERRPALTLRAALKTASEPISFHTARYYDSAGYFFDLAAGKSFGSIRLAASAGFLCWQTDNGRQNDAVLYDFRLSWQPGKFRLAASIGGYSGWEGDGDRPLTVKFRAGWSAGRLSPFVYLQHGLHDYPFTQFSAGLRYTFTR